MVDANAATMLERLPKIIPEGELPALPWMQRPEGIGVAKTEQCAVTNDGWFSVPARFRSGIGISQRGWRDDCVRFVRP